MTFNSEDGWFKELILRLRKESEACYQDLLTYGQYIIRDGKRIPPSEWIGLEIFKHKGPINGKRKNRKRAKGSGGQDS